MHWLLNFSSSALQLSAGIVNGISELLPIQLNLFYIISCTEVSSEILLLSLSMASELLKFRLARDSNGIFELPLIKG